MGCIQYDFLSESLFFNQTALETKFANESDSRVEKELADYRDFCIKNFEQIQKSIAENKSGLKLFSSVDITPIPLLKQTALYINQYTIADPLFPYTAPKAENEDDASAFFGYRKSTIKREEIASACKYLKMITPMIAGDYVKIFPISYYHERKTIPFYVPQNLFSDVLPLPILKFFQEHAEVMTMQKMKGSEGWAVIPGQLQIGRGIAVEFKGANFGSGMAFHLVQSETKIVDEEKREVVFVNTIPDTPPSQQEFDNWVIQSINSTARKYFNAVFQEMMVASSLGASYISDNKFTSDLITNNFELNDSIANFTATQMLNVDLPFMEKIGIDTVMDVRRNEADVFTNFRMELEKQFREMRLITDEKELKAKIDNVFHELNEVQEQKIQTKLNQLKDRLGWNLAMAFGGLAAGIQTNGFSLLATATAAGNGYKDYKEYRNDIKENPAYFLWRLKSASAKKN